MPSALGYGLMGAAAGFLGGKIDQAHQQQAVDHATRLAAAKAREEQVLAEIQNQYAAVKDERDHEQALELADRNAANRGKKGPMNVTPGGAVFDPETGEVVYENTNFRPSNFAVQEIQRPDGSVVQATFDPSTGAFRDLQGNLIAPPARGGAPAVPAEAPTDPESVVAAMESDQGAPFPPEQRSQILAKVASGQPFEVPAMGGDLPLGQGMSEQDKAAAKERGKQDAKREANEPKSAARMEAAQHTVTNAISIVDRAIENTDWTTTGFVGSIAKRIPGTPAVGLAGDIDTLLGVLSFAELQKMREASPTGGALGGIAVRELELLGSTVASLRQEQDPARVKENLGKVRKHLEAWRTLMQAAHDRNYGAGGHPGAAPAAPSGFRVIGVR